MEDIKKTCLYQQHLALKAKMGSFAGFEMPLQYSSVKDEIISVRQEVGIFDCSHMGEFLIEGPQAISFMDWLIPNDFAGAELKKAVYSPLCRDNGTMLDDLIAYKLGAEKVLICVNASNIQKDWEWIKAKHSEASFNCELNDISNDLGLIAIQGPKSEKQLFELGFTNIDSYPYYSAQELQWEGHKITLARTGYTGEDGFEFFAEPAVIVKAWDKLLKQGSKACGLVSRDVLRLEVGYPLYGHELTDEWTPLDAGLKWTVKMNKESFISKDELAQYSPKFRLAKISLPKGVAREGYSLCNDQNEPVGKITSGTMSPTLGRGIALALVEREKFPENKKFFVNIRNKYYEAEYHAKPFVTGGHK
jgi:aminomethyltransferase